MIKTYDELIDMSKSDLRAYGRWLDGQLTLLSALADELRSRMDRREEYEFGRVFWLTKAGYIRLLMSLLGERESLKSDLVQSQIELVSLRLAYYHGAAVGHA